MNLDYSILRIDANDLTQQSSKLDIIKTLALGILLRSNCPIILLLLICNYIIIKA